MSASTLPPLPRPSNWISVQAKLKEPSFTAEQITDYGQASRKAALEEAAQACMDVISSKDGERIPSNAEGAYECHDKIKELL